MTYTTFFLLEKDGLHTKEFVAKDGWAWKLSSMIQRFPWDMLTIIGKGKNLDLRSQISSDDLKKLKERKRVSNITTNYNKNVIIIASTRGLCILETFMILIFVFYFEPHIL